MMRTLTALGRSTIIARVNWAHEPGQRKRIDLWWGGLQNNGDLMLLLAYLLTLNHQWNDAKIFVRSIARSEEEWQSQLAALAELIPGTRIQAESEVILLGEKETIPELIRDHSRTADVVLLGLREPESGAEADYAATLEALASGLKTTIFVRSAGKFAGRLI
jgi:potassium/chloride transporter 4/5/6